MTQIHDPRVSGHALDPLAQAHAEDRAAVRRVLVGGVLGFVAIYALMLLMCWVIGISLGAAAGVGAFVALFGGAGFGAMMGGSLPSDHRS